MPGKTAGRGSANSYWLGGFLLLVATGGGLAYYVTRPDGSRPDALTHTVKKEVLQITVTEKGTVESSANKDLICKVRAGSRGVASAIKDVVPDGTRVKPGDVLMVLDDSALKEQEDSQRIIVKQAEAAVVKAEKEYQIVKEQTEGVIATARDTVENTRIDLEAYTGIASDPALTPAGAVAGAAATLVERGTFRQLLDDLNGQIALAQANVEQNRERADWAASMVKRSYMSPAQAQSEKSRLDSTVEDLRSKQAKRDQLTRYDRPKMLTTLRGAHEDAVRKLRQAELEAQAKQIQAKTEWDTSKDLLGQQKEKLQDILDQREECVIKAPADIKPDSMVVYFKPEGSRFSSSSSQSMIEQGAQVRESQKLLRIPNLDKMQVNTKVHEAMVSRIRMGQRTTVKVDAMSDRQFVGSVKWVAQVANQTDSWTSDVKLYQTLVQIEGELGPLGVVIPLSGEALKPDMTAEVTINVDAVREPVPTVPLQAILGGAEMGATREVFVKTAGGFDRRTVVLGLYNDRMVEVRSGLAEGDEVVINPKVLLGDKDKTRTRDGTESKADEKPPEPKAPGGPAPASPGSPNGPGAGGPGGYPGGGDPTKTGLGGPKGAGGKGTKGPRPDGAGGDPTKGGGGPKGAGPVVPGSAGGN